MSRRALIADAAWARTGSPTPSASSARSALGHRLRPAPTSVNSGARSRTSTCQPRWVSAIADASPAIPPPTTIAFTTIFLSRALHL